MKKIIASITLALIAISLPLSLVGCGKSSSPTIIGTWTQIKYIDYYPDGEINEQKIDDYTIDITFNKDNTALHIEKQRSESGTEWTNEDSGDWEINKNNTITVIWNFYDEKEDDYWTEVWTFKFEGKELHRIENKEDGRVRHEIFVKK